MTEIDPYIRTLFFSANGKLGITEAPARRSEIFPEILSKIVTVLENIGFSNVTDMANLSEQIIDELIEADVLRKEMIRFAGEYLTFHPVAYGEYRNRVLTNDAIYAASQRIGSRFFLDVFTGYLAETGSDDGSIPFLGLAPASSRIVTFSDNQIVELDEQTSQIISAISDQNQIGGISGLREIILGQLKAGRELIRAGSFRLHLLQITLIQSLQYIAERYEKELIGGLAAALITALIKHIGIDA